MVNFKFYDRQLKKFVSPFRGPESIWNIRFKLGLWDNSVDDKSIKTMYILVKKNGKFDLHFKSNGKFVLANDITVKEYMKSLANKKSVKNGGIKNGRKTVKPTHKKSGTRKK